MIISYELAAAIEALKHDLEEGFGRLEALLNRLREEDAEYGLTSSRK
jgi:hypothetical protein